MSKNILGSPLWGRECSTVVATPPHIWHVGDRSNMSARIFFQRPLL